MDLFKLGKFANFVSYKFLSAVKRIHLKSIPKAVRSRARKAAAALRRVSLKRGALWIAPVLALVCMTGDYFLNNTSVPLFSNSTSLWLPAMLMQKDTPVPDEVVMFDVAYDKELVPVVDTVFGDTVGSRVVTSRPRLLQMLEVLKGASYRYLFIDVRFESSDRTECDSALFAALLRMPRMSVSTHRSSSGYEIADTALLQCAGYSDYRHIYFDGFSHYELLQDGHPSAAARMYECMDGTRLNCAGGVLYTSGGRLCNNTVFLPLTDIGFGRERSGARTSDGMVEQSRLTLGHQVLDMMLPEEIHALVKDKIVLVGDFENDVHDTYVGEVPGPVLAYAAYRELRAGHHLVSRGYLLALFAVYTLIGFCMMLKSPLYDMVLDHYRINMWQLRFGLSLIGYGSMLMAAMLVCYLLWGTSLNIKVPCWVFGTLALYLSFIKSRK